MSISEIIKKRRSVRTFDGIKLREEDASAIMEYANKVENPYSIPIEWKLLDADEYGLSSPVIVGANAYLAGKMRRVPHAEEAFGYAFEKIVLFAVSIGVGTTWIAGTMNRAAFERAMSLDGDEVMPCVSPIGYAAKKMSLRETMMRKVIKADGRADFKELFFDGGFVSPLTEEKARDIKDALSAVRLAPSAVNKQPWRVVVQGDKVHFYEKQSKGYVSDNGWDIQKIDMGIALCHFELVAKECGLDVAFEISEPDLSLDDVTHYIASYVIK